MITYNVSIIPNSLNRKNTPTLQYRKNNATPCLGQANLIHPQKVHFNGLFKRIFRDVKFEAAADYYRQITTKVEAFLGSPIETSKDPSVEELTKALALINKCNGTKKKPKELKFTILERLANKKDISAICKTKYLQEALQSATTDVQRFQINDELGTFFLNDKNHVQAEKYFKEALQSATTDVQRIQINHKLGASCLNDKNYVEAEKYLQAAFSLIDLKKIPAGYSTGRKSEEEKLYHFCNIQYHLPVLEDLCKVQEANNSPSLDKTQKLLKRYDVVLKRKTITDFLNDELAKPNSEYDNMLKDQQIYTTSPSGTGMDGFDMEPGPFMKQIDDHINNQQYQTAENQCKATIYYFKTIINEDNNDHRNYIVCQSWRMLRKSYKKLAEIYEKQGKQPEFAYLDLSEFN